MRKEISRLKEEVETLNSTLRIEQDSNIRNQQQIESLKLKVRQLESEIDIKNTTIEQGLKEVEKQKQLIDFIQKDKDR